MKYTIIEMFGAFSKMELMNDFDIVTLFNNFRYLKQNPLYTGLLSEYHFDEKGICSELISDIATAMINEDIIIINKKQLFFNSNPKLTDKIIDNVPNKQLCHSFVNDYKKLLIENEISKQR